MDIGFMCAQWDIVTVSVEHISVQDPSRMFFNLA